jgi:hypothetical protein
LLIFARLVSAADLDIFIGDQRPDAKGGNFSTVSISGGMLLLLLLCPAPNRVLQRD